MPLSKIEEVLFHDQSAHFIEAFDLSTGTLTIRLLPGFRTELTRVARFSDCEIVLIDKSHADENLQFPWGIIGFEAKPLSESRWQFCLFCDAAEYVFESQWPVLSVAT